jgi:hypothetical protein
MATVYTICQCQFFLVYFAVSYLANYDVYVIKVIIATFLMEIRNLKYLAQKKIKVIYLTYVKSLCTILPLHKKHYAL